MEARKVLVLSGIILVLALSSSQGMTTTLISPGGDESVDGGMRVVLDAYGGFGSYTSPADNAWFNPSGTAGAAGTTFESGVFLGGIGQDSFLVEGHIGSSGGLPSVNFSTTSDHSATSAFSRGDLSFALNQSVEDRFDSGGAKVGSMLVQEYTMTNAGASDLDFSLTRYLDGDLYFEGGFSNDWGGASTVGQAMNQQLFEFDSGDDPLNPTTLTAIRSIGGTVPEDHFEVSAFSGLRSKIISGGGLDNSIHGDGADEDLVTDGPYDITLAQQRDFSLSAGETQGFFAVTEFGQGTTVEDTVDPIASVDQTIPFSRGPRPRARYPDAEYSVEFTDQQDLEATIAVHLTGDAAVGPAGEDLRQIWEDGIEDVWNGQYEIVDGIHRYPIVVDVVYVDNAADADVSITVHSGSGGVDARNFYTDNPSNHGFALQGIVAAHEAGHWLGLYDEYNPMNWDPITGVRDPAFWPLYNFDDTVLTDFWGLYDGEYGSPLGDLDNDGVADWITTSDPADQTGLMGRNGTVRERYYANLFEWLGGESGRPGLVLGQAPTFTTWMPTDGPADWHMTTVSIPAPSALLLCCAGTGFVGWLRRRKFV